MKSNQIGIGKLIGISWKQKRDEDDTYSLVVDARWDYRLKRCLQTKQQHANFVIKNLSIKISILIFRTSQNN